MVTFGSLSWPTKIIFIVNMIVGRLELIPFLAMLHPDFWRLKK
jgi:trk system potassium uptake protein TrkH